ncbi:MAG: hypothetical protein HY678_04800 [Chloroflexi bacterium]|nr:hypothetical protein [Chloroflexota bacterium]
MAKVDLSYSKNGGLTWLPTKSLAVAPTEVLAAVPTSYRWKVPAGLNTSKAKVKVTLRDAKGRNIGSDASNRNFKIVP